MDDSNGAIQPIPTLWRGITFRSRTEARWAAFFDYAGIAWEYEPQAFTFDFGCYVPDFWLPHVSMYAEVKAKALDDRERRLAKALAIRTGCSVLQLVGPPELRSYDAFEVLGEELLERDYLLDPEPYYASEKRFYGSTDYQGEPVPAGVMSRRYKDALIYSRTLRFEDATHWGRSNMEVR